MDSDVDFVRETITPGADGVDVDFKPRIDDGFTRSELAFRKLICLGTFADLALSELGTDTFSELGMIEVATNSGFEAILAFSMGCYKVIPINKIREHFVGEGNKPIFGIWGFLITNKVSLVIASFFIQVQLGYQPLL